MCHHNSFLIYTSLENPTEKRWNLVTHTSVFTSMIVTLLFGVLGYVTFTGLVQGKVKSGKEIGDGCKLILILPNPVGYLGAKLGRVFLVKCVTLFMW